MVASYESSTPIAYRIAAITLHDGSVWYGPVLIFANGSERRIGHMRRTIKGARNQKWLADVLAGLREVTQ